MWQSFVSEYADLQKLDHRLFRCRQAVSACGGLREEVGGVWHHAALPSSYGNQGAAQENDGQANGRAAKNPAVLPSGCLSAGDYEVAERFQREGGSLG